MQRIIRISISPLYRHTFNVLSQEYYSSTAYRGNNSGQHERNSLAEKSHTAPLGDGNTGYAKLSSKTATELQATIQSLDHKNDSFATTNEELENPENGPSTTPDSLVKTEMKKSYVFDFGIYKGKQLWQVPRGYIYALFREGKIRDDLAFIQAMKRYNIFDLREGPLLTYRLEKWAAPNLDAAPQDFRDKRTNDHLWIRAPDIYKFFNVGEKFILGLPLVDKTKKASRHRYFLFHIYELLRHYGSSEQANTALEDWLAWKGDLDDESASALGQKLNRSRILDKLAQKRVERMPKGTTKSQRPVARASYIRQI